MRKYILISVTVLLMILTGCMLTTTSGTGGESTSERGIAKVYLTDRPVGDLEALFVEISGARYHYELDSTEVTLPVDLATTVDLLSLSGTEIELFDLGDIPPEATLVWIGLNLESATAQISGEEKSVEILGRETKIMVHQKVGTETDVILDFDVGESLIEAGPEFSPFYMLKPVIKPVLKRSGEGEKNVYDVEGILVTPDGTPIPRAAVVLLPTDESTVLRTTLSRRDGSFRIIGVESGEYELWIFADAPILGEGESYTDLTPSTVLSIEVSGADVDLGEIVVEGE